MGSGVMRELFAEKCLAAGGETLADGVELNEAPTVEGHGRACAQCTAECNTLTVKM